MNEPISFKKNYLEAIYAAAAKSLQSCSTLCDSVDSSPPGSPRPWDSPGKNTGVGCHFPLQCRKVKSEREVTPSCPTLSDPMDCSPPGSSIPGIFRARALEWGAIAFSEIHTALYKIRKWDILYYSSKQKELYAIITEKAMAPHSSTLAWKIPWMEEPGGL